MTDILDRLEGALADRYAIERELGSGGMATVYLAQDMGVSDMVSQLRQINLQATIPLANDLKEAHP